MNLLFDLFGIVIKISDNWINLGNGYFHGNLRYSSGRMTKHLSMQIHLYSLGGKLFPVKGL
jgi:hypothetical protein